LALILRWRRAHLFGGLGALSAGLFCEIILSALLAPVRMWFHTKFVVLTVLGRDIKWGAQSRAGNETGWAQAIRFHGFATIAVTAWFAVIAWIDPSFSWWLLPVAGPLMLSVPLAVYLSRVSVGQRLRRVRLLLTPEEIAPPEVVQNMQRTLGRAQSKPPKPSGLMRLLTDRSANALRVALLRGKAPVSTAARMRNRTLREKLLTGGPKSLNPKEGVLLLRDAESLTLLHHELAPVESFALETDSTITASRRRSDMGRLHRIREGRTAPPGGRDMAKAARP
jgi:membrane glycosyltransferase